MSLSGRTTSALVLRDYASRSNAPTAAPVGTLRFEPNAINVIPSRAVFTVDQREPDEDSSAPSRTLAQYLNHLANAKNVSISSEPGWHPAVVFDTAIVSMIEEVAAGRGLKSRRMTAILFIICASCPASDGQREHRPRDKVVIRCEFARVVTDPLADWREDHRGGGRATCKPGIGLAIRGSHTTSTGRWTAGKRNRNCRRQFGIPIKSAGTPQALALTAVRSTETAGPP